MKNIRAFLSGMLTSALLGALVVTAGAAGSKMEWNTVNLKYNSHLVLTQGHTITVENGAEVPSSILYTDVQGGGTTYVPARYLLETLGMPVTWDDESNTIRVNVEGDYALNLLGTGEDAYTEFEGFREVAVVTPEEGGKVLASASLYYPEKQTFAEKTLVPNERNGKYVSFLITNHDPKPLQFSLGVRKHDSMATALTVCRIPPISTTVYTIEVTDFEKIQEWNLYYRLGCPEDVHREVAFDLQVVQFKEE